VSTTNTPQPPNKRHSPVSSMPPPSRFHAVFKLSCAPTPDHAQKQSKGDAKENPDGIPMRGHRPSSDEVTTRCRGGRSA
jgi:hypothetical protein